MTAKAVLEKTDFLFKNCVVLPDPLPISLLMGTSLGLHEQMNLQVALPS
jgi:hypothetical protein